MKQKKSKPTISVIMPLFNTKKYLREAIKSIQNQSYKDWELIIVDDFSTDGSFELAKKITKKDKRISTLRNGQHRGAAGATSFGLRFAKGRYIARMDSDDISLPDRLAGQLAYLKTNKEVIAVGGQVDLMTENGQIYYHKSFPTNPSEIKNMMFKNIPVQQATMLVDSKKLPKNFVWYEKGIQTAEEVELLFKLFQYGKVANIESTVYQYRQHKNSLSYQNPKKTFYLTLKARLKAIFSYSYKPSVSGLVTTIAQTLLITLLPNEAIYPTYYFLRGIKNGLMLLFVNISPTKS